VQILEKFERGNRAVRNVTAQSGYSVDNLFELLTRTLIRADFLMLQAGSKEHGETVSSISKGTLN